MEIFVQKALHDPHIPIVILSSVRLPQAADVALLPFGPLNRLTEAISETVVGKMPYATA